MNEFVNWCNTNVGFVSLVLSFLTLAVSIIAVIVSVHTARLPYKKKILVTTGNYISTTECGLHVTATNVGNRNIKVKTIGFLFCGKVYVNKNTLFNSQIVLGQGETTSQYFNLQDFQNTLISSQISPNTRIIGFVEDTEGTRYKKRLAKAKRILKQKL